MLGGMAFEDTPERTDRLSIGVGLMMIAASVAVAAAEPPTQPDLPRWRVLPIRSQAEYERGLIGGEAEQHPHGIARSRSNPDRIYLSHDVGQIWRSDDNGRTWDRTLGVGMFVQCGQSVEVDPIDDDVVLAIVDSAWDWFARDYEGVYRSVDAGETWKLVLAAAGEHQRFDQHNLAYDPSSIGPDSAKRWYAAFPNNALYRSEDNGRSWRKATDLGGHARVYAVRVHPTDGRTVYVASSEGLWVSSDRGSYLRRLGDLPDGEVSGLAPHPTRTGHLYAVVEGLGLFTSADGGRSFTQLKAHKGRGVFVNGGSPQVIYLTGRSFDSVVSRDGGQTWTTLSARPAPGLDRGGKWKTTLGGAQTGIAPDPRNPAGAVAYSHATIWRSEDDPSRMVDSSTLFTGYAWGWWNGGVAFHPTDPDRFWLLCCDIGSVETRNAGTFFTRHPVPYRWRARSEVHWTGMYAGALQPETGSDVVVASVGMYFDTRLIRSDDAGRTWTIVDDRTENHLFVGFHPTDPDLVFAGTKRSTDAGRTFQRIEGLRQSDGFVVGIAPGRPDTVYAISIDRRKLLRSDDRGDTWRIYAEPGWRLNPFDSKPVFAMHPTDPDRIYTPSRRGNLAEFDGQTWRVLDVLKHVGADRPRNCVSRIVFDPRRPEIVYAATHACGLPFLFRSTDGGRTWLDISGNLPRIGAGGLAVSPHTGDVLVGGCCGTRVFPPPYKSPNAVYHRLPDDWRTRPRGSDRER